MFRCTVVAEGLKQRDSSRGIEAGGYEIPLAVPPASPPPYITPLPEGGDVDIDLAGRSLDGCLAGGELQEEDGGRS